MLFAAGKDKTEVAQELGIKYDTLRKAIDKPFEKTLLQNVTGAGYRLAAIADE